MSEGHPAARRVRCPHCGAKPYARCLRMPVDTYHYERMTAARAAKPNRLQKLFRAAGRMLKP